MEPDVLIRLSVKLGLDLTPNEDLEERFEYLIKVSESCISDLDALGRLVRTYAGTVKNLEDAQ